MELDISNFTKEGVFNYIQDNQETHEHKIAYKVPGVCGQESVVLFLYIVVHDRCMSMGAAIVQDPEQEKQIYPKGQDPDIQRILFHKSPRHFGGYKYSFICPHTKKICQKLYLQRNGYLASRYYLGNKYDSQVLSKRQLQEKRMYNIENLYKKREKIQQKMKYSVRSGKKTKPRVQLDNLQDEIRATEILRKNYLLLLTFNLHKSIGWSSFFTSEQEKALSMSYKEILQYIRRAKQHTT